MSMSSHDCVDNVYVKFITVADNKPDILYMSNSWLMLITNQTLLMIYADNQPDIMTL